MTELPLRKVRGVLSCVGNRQTDENTATHMAHMHMAPTTCVELNIMTVSESTLSVEA
jgi:hypothetical protein